MPERERVKIRAETTADRAPVRELLAGAFSGGGEAELVERLRQAGDAAIAMVADRDGSVVAHIMFSRMRAPFRALALAPLAVEERSRNRGIGARLVSEGLERARRERWQGVFVLGDPAYYGRFGFSAELASGFSCPWSGPHLMALALDGGGLPVRNARIGYATAFSRLG